MSQLGFSQDHANEEFPPENNNASSEEDESEHPDIQSQHSVHDDEESSYSGEYPAQETYERTEETEQNEGEDASVSSAEQERFPLGQFDDTDNEENNHDVFADDPAETADNEDDDATDYPTGVNPDPFTIGTEQATTLTKSDSTDPDVTQPNGEGSQNELAESDDVNARAPGGASSSSSTLQDEHGHQEEEDNEDASNYDENAPAIAESNDVEREEFVVEEEDSEQHDDYLDHSNFAENWISDEPQAYSDLHNGESAISMVFNDEYVHDEDHATTFAEGAAIAVDSGYGVGENELDTGVVSIDDWQVHLNGVEYTEENADTANYDLDVSAPILPEISAPLNLGTEDDNIEYRDEDFNQQAEGEATTADSPLGKRTWDEHNDGLEDEGHDQGKHKRSHNSMN